MRMILCYPTRGQIEAVLLCATPEQMRVVVPDCSDVLEFRLIDGQWMSDSGTAVEIDALMTDSPAAAARVWNQGRPRALAAGS